MRYILATSMCFPLVTVMLLASATEPASPEMMVRAVAQKWSHANAARDMDALSLLYADEVSFYGTTMSQEDCLSNKKEFFQKNPSFTQSIQGDIKVRKNDDSRGYTASFIKQVVVSGKTRSFPAYLVIDEFEREDDKNKKGWKIVVESDEVTDANLLKQKSSFNVKSFKTCEDAVMGVFKSAKEIRKKITPTIILEVEEREPNKIYVLHLYYVPPLYGMTMTMGWYEFDAKTKVLTDTGSYEELEYDRKSLPYVDKLCR